MIRRIELVNFMSHAHTVIEPAEGLTVLVGPNNCGKSAVVAALQILCHNETSTYVLRHGERECSVSIETNDGHAVQWSRKGSSPRYVINGRTFDRLERNSAPEGLHEVLRLPMVTADGDREFDVHFGEQKSPVFLLDKPGSHAAQFFASSSDAASLVEMQRRHTQKIAEARRDRVRLDAEAQRLALELAILSGADATGTSIREAEASHIALEISALDLSRLTTDARLLTEANGALENQIAEAATLAPVRPPPALAETKSLSLLVAQLTKAVVNLEYQASLADRLVNVRPAPALAEEHLLTRLIDDLSAARRNDDLCAAECAAVHLLRSPPLMSDAESLRVLLREVSIANHRMNGEDERAAVLNALAPQPELTGGSALLNDLDLLRRSLASLRRAESACEYLAHLSPPSELANTTDIAGFIALWGQARAAVDAQEQNAQNAIKELRGVQSALRRWAEEHQVCPTCGGKVDPARIAEHAMAHGGGTHA